MRSPGRSTGSRAYRAVDDPGLDPAVLVGIQRRGAIIARRIATAIGGMDRSAPPVGSLDIALYRDDLTELGAYPVVRPTELPFDIEGRRVVLVDDVLFTGRTSGPPSRRSPITVAPRSCGSPCW